MATIKPFKAFRPVPGLANRIAALPYDVINTDEAREIARENPYSFLHVDKAEIDLHPSVHHYDKSVYEKANDNLRKMINEGMLVKDNADCFYIYKQVMNGRAQIGLVGCTSIDDYLNNVIRKHEHTRADKEQDRINHVDFCNANTGPIFLTYKAKDEINYLINECMSGKEPLYNFTSEDDITHTVWIIQDLELINALLTAFAGINCLYIADGHHRSASAVKVGLKRRTQFPGFDGTEEFNFFLSVLFPHDQLYIMDYNRVVNDLNGNDVANFINKIIGKFDVKPFSKPLQYKPTKKGTFGMYLDGMWYKLTAKRGTFNPNDPVESLDVSILQNNLLGPILGIKDPRTDKRIDFVGGIRGLEELEKRVNDGMKVAFTLYPTSIEELMAISDAGEVMPPKSTWFEPKLRSGLFIHALK